jgi:hypothetical protein
MGSLVKYKIAYKVGQGEGEVNKHGDSEVRGTTNMGIQR